MRSCILSIVALLAAASADAAPSYLIVGTGQATCYDATRAIPPPRPGQPFYGQDAQHPGIAAAYRNNGDGTVSDLNTGLMWQRDPGVKLTCDQAAAGAHTCRTGGHADWRLPTIKELYSLIDFSGSDPRPDMDSSTRGLHPFINTNVFSFQYGKASEGDRIIDSQYASATFYVGPSMGPDGRKMFGVNFADGRIKGYGLHMRDRDKTFYVLYVRGNPEYGRNHFMDNGDGTVTDAATGLIWQQADSGKDLDWAAALAYAATLRLAGHSDWRLPNAKELQSIVDYARAPDKTASAAIDPVFRTTAIRNEAGQTDYPCYWTSTSHVSLDGRAGAAVYVAFGRAMGFMRGHWVDVHGAGAQRSDPKEGNPADYSQGRGPQGDAVRILNSVRCVRGGTLAAPVSTPSVTPTSSAAALPPPADASRMSGASLPIPRTPGSFVRHLDRNGDGKVSRDEFDGPPDQFDVLDRNHDGFLTEDEAPPFPPPRR